jgi:hypothetical protein
MASSPGSGMAVMTGVNTKANNDLMRWTFDNVTIQDGWAPDRMWVHCQHDHRDRAARSGGRAGRSKLRRNPAPLRPRGFPPRTGRVLRPGPTRQQARSSAQPRKKCPENHETQPKRAPGDRRCY